MTEAGILWLGSPDVTLETSGRKAVNLSRLLGAGFRVPPGFIVPVHAYRAFVDTNCLSPRLADLTRSLTDSRLGNHSATIQELVEESSIPKDLEHGILEAYRTLGKPLVAVRSSALAEDLPSASSAGQMDTFLNEIGRAHV